MYYNMTKGYNVHAQKKQKKKISAIHYNNADYRISEHCSQMFSDI